MEAIYWDHYYNHILLLNLFIAIGLFGAIRLFSGAIAHIDASYELFTKDNPAFGISLAATTFAVTIMLSGTIYGSPEVDRDYAIISVGVFGIIGIILMAITRIIFDKLALPGISLRNEIVKGNMAVAIADAGNVLAAGVIIHAVMVWVIGFGLKDLVPLLAAYGISQVLLTSMTLIKRKLFKTLHKGFDLQEELKNGNIALALRFAGLKIGVAFSLATAANMVVYDYYHVLTILNAWFIASLAIITAWGTICFVTERLILWGVNTKKEVLEQRNIAIGSFQAVIFISIGLLIYSL
jgi:uncharacterized membrane protein YjfL (UPF0719 family)